MSDAPVPNAVPPTPNEKSGPPDSSKETPPEPVHDGHSHGGLWPLALGALGIVFGDIGTSPLYALTECFSKKKNAETGLMEVGAHSLEVNTDNVMGILSLMFWSLMMVVTFKYISYIMKANNKGEGGIFALLALVPKKPEGRTKTFIILAALFGAALLYGDGIITPAVSVLSAVEGLSVATHAFDPYIVPITLVILTGLFMVQKRGTEKIGRAFGPIMVVWFLVIAGLGIRGISDNFEILSALNPLYAVKLFQIDLHRAFFVLGSVVLCITGGEALYADMGHFGAKPIRIAWFLFVLPALLLNYFGQGAFLLKHGWIEKPFWGIVPEIMIYPMVVLAMMATVIASQALISGAYSLTRQAVQLGYFPRVTIVHTSEKAEGQIYVPEINTALMVACLAIVLLFKESSALAAAYGIAVTGTMGITSLVYFFVVTKNWGWSVAKALPLVALFLVFDLGFFLANLVKFFEGGWFPIAVAIAMFGLMTTWKRGRKELSARFMQSLMPISALLDDVEMSKPHRVRGTAVFMSGNSDGTPPVLLHHLKHNQVLHRQVVLLSILSEPVPSVPKEDQLEVNDLHHGFFRVIWKTGFMETPNVPAILLRCRELGLVCEPSTTSYFLGRETLLTTGKSSMMRWRKGLFSFVSRNAIPATSYFGLPPGRVVELGMQVDL
jgi:KUP system potassium uptake protein